MSLLSDIGSGLLNIGSGLVSGFKNLFSGTGSQTANISNAFNLSNETPSSRQVIPMSVKPVASSPFGPISSSGFINLPGGQGALNVGGLPTNASSRVATNVGVITITPTGGGNYYQPAITVTPYQPPNTAQPLPAPNPPSPSPPPLTMTHGPYMPEPGKTGEAGGTMGSIGGGATSTIGTSGLTGYGGSAAHTGLLGGVQAGTDLTALSSTEEEKNKTYTIKPGDTLSQIAKQLGVSLGDITQANPQITNPNLIRTGQTINIPSATAGTTQPSQISLPQVVSSEGVVNLGSVQEGINKIKDLLKSPLSQQTISDLNNYLENTKQVLYQAQAQLNPALNMPEPMPVPPIENPSPDFIITWEDIARKYGLPDQIKQMEDMRTKILAESQAYDIITKDIQNDSDFPKRLAERRLAAIEKAKNTNLQAMQLQLNFLVDNYNQKLEMAKYETGLYQQQYQTQRTAKERAVDNNRAMLQQMISTGAFGDMTDSDLQQWANATGYTLESLKAMRKAVKTGNDLKISQARANLEKTIQSAEQTTKAPTSTTGANYNTRLSQEIANLYSGRYGTTGAREKVIQILKNEFPSVDVAKDIYNRVPDNWEQSAKKVSPLSFEDF
jgi:LysM repeat protein